MSKRKNGKSEQVTEAVQAAEVEAPVTAEQLVAVVEGEVPATAPANGKGKKPSEKGMNVKMAKSKVTEIVGLLNSISTTDSNFLSDDMMASAKSLKAELEGLIAPKAKKASKKKGGGVSVPADELARLRQIEKAMMDLGYTIPTTPLAEQPRVEPADGIVPEPAGK